MSTRQDYISAISALVAGELPLGEPDKVLALAAAVKRYSGDSPRKIPEDIPGNGGFDYPLASLASWTDKFSKVSHVEYPVDDSRREAKSMPDTQWRIYAKPTGDCLRFLAATPAAAEQIRITYTALHVCDDIGCSIPDSDAEAVQMLAAANFCEMLATYFANTADSVIRADSVDHKSRAQEYSSRARAYRQAYFAHLGIRSGSSAPASVTRDQDATPSWRGDHLTHPRRFR